MQGKELRELRDELGMSQARLAKEVGVSSNAIALAERGERGIGEPLARLVRMLVQVHRGELIPRKSKIKRGER
jgi:transcriptional regulator with XRE-family HTH domain